jgi:transposase-like protein
MPKKRYNAEEIIHKIRETDVLLSQGKSVSQACKQIGVSDQTYYRWPKIYGGIGRVGKATQPREINGGPPGTRTLDHRVKSPTKG